MLIFPKFLVVLKEVDFAFGHVKSVTDDDVFVVPSDVYFLVNDVVA